MSSGRRRITSWQFIALGYLTVILTGCLLLSLPVSSKAHTWTPFIDSLFTAVSATCVTGLVVFDTFTHWTMFGQIVILLLIQVGGIGFMTIITLFAMLIGKHIGLYERKILVQSAGNLKMSGVLRLIKRILIGTAIFEGIGTLLLSIRFIPEFGVGKGIYYAIFHSISAFCNAGFDLMGVNGQFSSFTAFSGDIIVNLTLMSLIFMGGIGFLVWSDIIDCKLNYKRFSLYTKIVLVASVSLIVLSTSLYLLFERNNLLSDMSFGRALLASLFQSITPRTAGFNTIDTSALSNSSVLLTMVLMFIGASSGSTSGGIKITTFVVILFGIAANARNRSEIIIGKRRLESNLTHYALALTASYMMAVITGTLIISAIEPSGLKEILFEVISAMGTVGLTMGITPGLTSASKIIIMMLMYAGRVGIITLALAFSEKRSNPPVKMPVEKMLIG